MKFIDRSLYYNKKGIYIIKNIINNKIYVGSTYVKFSNRYISHRSRLKRNVHHSPYLQNSYNKYGKDNFLFIPIEILEDNETISIREEYWIKFYDTVLNGYNVMALVEGKRTINTSKARKRIDNKKTYKKVCQYTLNGKYLKTYKGIDCVKVDGFRPKSVSECCCRRLKSHKGYLWKYYNENFKDNIKKYKPHPHTPHMKIVDLQYNIEYLGFKNTSIASGKSIKHITWDVSHKQRRFKRII